MWAPKSSPYSKSNSFWPDFSTGMASSRPFSLAWDGMPLGSPNCSSTRQPLQLGSMPSSAAFSIPSKMRCLASAMVSVCSGVGSPSIPNIFFWKEPRWSKARM